MISQNFEYTVPKTLDEALGLLASGAKPLSGGMSLIPMMKLRLATPEHLVDLGRVKELSYIREEGGALHIGATTTHDTVLSSALIRSQCPLLSETASKFGNSGLQYYIADRYIRAFQALAASPNSRLVVVPMESAGLAGGIVQAMQLLRDGDKTGAPS